MAKSDVTGIREYVNQARDGHGNVLPAGEEPALVATVFVPDGTSEQHTFNVKTRFFLIYTNVAINFSMVANGNPTAIINGAGRMAVDTSQFLGVKTGGKDDAGLATPQKIALILDPD